VDSQNRRVILPPTGARSPLQDVDEQRETSHKHDLDTTACAAASQSPIIASSAPQANEPAVITAATFCDSIDRVAGEYPINFT